MTGTSPSPAAPDLDRRILALQTLAEELTPAKSLGRIDAATARATSQLTLVGTLLTGLGLVAAGQPTSSVLARPLAVAAVIFAALSVVCALTAQVLTISRGLNTNNLAAVEAWYRSQFRRRAYLARAATVLLLVSVVLAGSVAATALFPSARTRATIAISQTQAQAVTAGGGALTVAVTFHNVAADNPVTVVITAARPGPRYVLARAVATPEISGVASRTLTVSDLPDDAVIDVVAIGGEKECRGRLDVTGDDPPSVTCRALQ